MLGSVPEQELLSLVEAIAQEDALTALEQVRHLLDRGREPMVVLHHLAGVYRDLLIAKHAGDRPELVSCTAEGWARLNILAGQITNSTLISCQQKLAAAETQLRQTTQPRLWLEITVIGLMAAEPPPAPTQPIPSPAPQRQPPAPRDPQPLKPPTSQDPVAIWQEVERLLSTPSRAIFQQLQPELVEINSTDVLVGLRSKRDETTKNIATQKRADLEKAFERVLHRPLKVRYQFLSPNQGQPVPAPPELPPPSTEPKAAPAIAPTTSDDVAIRNVADLFQGQVIALEDESSMEQGKPPKGS
ncbi:MAG: hypothetical protein HC919_12535 [Oscillatoriales cyanobacterium SM2_2_1]|nr:hypothetical protein [Oscillatoriales cyanobacterium SM2_2_1]